MEIYFEDPKKILPPQRNFSYRGVKSIASENKRDLEKIAEKEWLDSKGEFIVLPDMVIIRDLKTLEIKGHTVYYASAVGYLGN